MTFKQYSIGYLELLSRMAFAGAPGSKERAAGRRATLYMLAVLLLMGGADGLPFEQDVEDAIDGILQRLGYNFSSKRSKQAFLTDTLGQGGADFVLKGVSSMPGMPVDVAGRFGMGNLIPGTGLLTKKDSYTRDLGELTGPAGDMAKRAFTATGKLLGGDLAGAALDITPAAVRNAAKGADMITTGAYRDTRGYNVNDTSHAEAAMKMISFQPNSTADIQEAKGQALNMVGQNRMRSMEIAEHWAQGLAARDMAMVGEARAWRDEWNEKNPATPIKVNMPGVIKRVQAMRQDAVLRMQKSAPAALKQTVRRELAEIRSE
ncbi:PLxRFG domain-containing protein, partial [Massilia antarctica]|uniref:PLxRFG domain-containing protein n=1 Tax=Massilia antarctica TaxID=2765360 RepID=UPI0035ED676A